MYKKKDWSHLHHVQGIPTATCELSFLKQCLSPAEELYCECHVYTQIWTSWVILTVQPD